MKIMKIQKQSTRTQGGKSEIKKLLWERTSARTDAGGSSPNKGLSGRSPQGPGTTREETPGPGRHGAAGSRAALASDGGLSGGTRSHLTTRPGRGGSGPGGGGGRQQCGGGHRTALCPQPLHSQPACRWGATPPHRPPGAPRRARHQKPREGLRPQIRPVLRGHSPSCRLHSPGSRVGDRDGPPPSTWDKDTGARPVRPDERLSCDGSQQELGV